MSFGRYHPSERSSESDPINNNHNGQGTNIKKFAPVKIIQNKEGQNEERRNYPQLNLRFQTAKEIVQRQDPTVTIPLSFLQQLLQQAYSNKQLKALDNTEGRSERGEYGRQPLVVEDLMKQIEIQQQRYSQPIKDSIKDYKLINIEDKTIQQFLLSKQMDYLQNSQQAKAQIELFFTDNPQLLPHFQTWLKKIEVKGIEEMLIVCYTETKNQQFKDIFKTLFQKLSIEFYSKQAFALIMRDQEIKEKIKYLSMAGEILNKIAKPQEYFYFGRQKY